MTEKFWVFPAIFCLLLGVAFYETFSIVGFLLSVIWLIRIFLLKHRPIQIITVILGTLFLGTIFLRQNVNNTALTSDETDFIVYPKVTSIKVDGDRIRFEGMVQKQSVQERTVITYYVKTEGEKQAWLNTPPFQHLYIEGELKEPASNSNFNQFNYQNYLKRKNIYWQLEAEKIKIINDQRLKVPIGSTIEKLRYSIFSYIDKYFHKKIADYLKVLFFSDKRYFSEKLLQTYRSLGVVHLFSISGFHISYLVHVLRMLFLRMGISHERTNSLLMFILPVYGALADFGISVFRAVFQHLFIIMSAKRNRPIATIDAWSLTLVLSLFINPGQIYLISFQLSYLLSGIFILVSRQKWIREMKPLISALLFTVMSTVASFPILSFHFFEIPWISIFSNLLFIPFFSYVLFPALLTLFLVSFILHKLVIFNVFERIIIILIQLVESMLSLSTNIFDFQFVTGRLPAFIMLILILSIFSVLINIERKRKPNLLASTLIVFSLCYYRISPIGYVVMLDVGQGDSILIKEPLTGKVTLIDTGGQLKWEKEETWREREIPFSIGKNLIAPSLKSLGISAVDRLYLTHADADHSGEVRSLAENFTIHEIAATKSTLTAPAVYGQLSTLENTEIVVVEPPQFLQYPAKNTLALHPNSDVEYEDNNNQSLVLYVTLGEDIWLFTGDIEREAEIQLINDYPNLRIDYLKVSHHGSKTSSTNEFLQHVESKVALISAGEDNRFGHPHPEVIERYKRYKNEIYSTSEHGAIMCRYLKIPFMDYWLTDIKTVHKN